MSIKYLVSTFLQTYILARTVIKILVSICIFRTDIVLLNSNLKSEKNKIFNKYNHLSLKTKNTE